MARGMLGDLFGDPYRALREEEKPEEQMHQFQAVDPFRAMAHAAYSGATLAGKGLGRAAVALGGGDPRTPLERNVQAIQAAKEQVAGLGLDPEDPKSIDEFYKRTIDILRKQGLAAEALAIAREWTAAKQASRRADVETEKLGLERDKLRERAERDKRAHELGILRIASQQEIAAARNTTAREIADAKLTAEQLKDGPFKAIDYNDRVEIINKHGEVISVKQKGLSPKDETKTGAADRDAEQAYAEYMGGLQRQYDAAVQLHNHAGVPGITGRLGSWVGEPDKGLMRLIATMVAPAQARAALALHEQVSGGAFLAGLTKLKAASKTGATGLGAVSEKEGDKVQADAAALNRVQEPADYRRQLAIYIREMEGFADRMAAAAQADKLTPRPLQKRGLMVPRSRGGAAAPAAPAAPSAPAASAAQPSNIDALLQKYPPKK